MVSETVRSSAACMTSMSRRSITVRIGDRSAASTALPDNVSDLRMSIMLKPERTTARFLPVSVCAMAE